MRWLCALFFLFFETIPAQASESAESILDMTHSWVGFASLGIFLAAYALVMLEEKLHLRKSKPVLLAAGSIWVLIALFITLMV